MSKKVVNIISIIIAIGIVIAVLYIHVFSKYIHQSDKSESAKVEKEEYQIIPQEKDANGKINEQEEKAKKDIESAELISDESLQTKISFIEEYTRKDLEEVDEETILNIAYNAYFLKNLKEYSNLTESPFFQLGEKASEYAKESLLSLEGKNKEIPENQTQNEEKEKNKESENNDKIEENTTDEKNEKEDSKESTEEEKDTIAIGTETVEKEKIETLRIEIKNIMNEINKDRANKVKAFAKTLKMNEKN